MDNFFGTTILEKALDAAILRQQVISNNIANVNTPGFRPSAVAFEDQLKKAIAAQDEGGFEVVAEDLEPEQRKMLGDNYQLAGLQPSVMQEQGEVDVNKQMVNLAKNQILYNALVQKISGNFTGLKYVIDNSGR